MSLNIACPEFFLFPMDAVITGLSGKITSLKKKPEDLAVRRRDVANAEAVRLKKTIVLVGMMGAGKTAIGKALASKLHVPFLDSDAEIEAAATMKISEIFERDGEDFFRDRETEVIDRLLDGETGILSTGGGAFLAERNRILMSQKGVSVLLKADLKLLWNRVKHKDTRPLLRTANPYQTLKALYEARMPIYDLADVHVQARSSYSIDNMADKVLEALVQRGDILETCA